MTRKRRLRVLFRIGRWRSPWKPLCTYYIGTDRWYDHATGRVLTEDERRAHYARSFMERPQGYGYDGKGAREPPGHPYGTAPDRPIMTEAFRKRVEAQWPRIFGAPRTP